jgi:putative flippase GtrA
LIASLRERFGRLIHELVKFGVVGAAGFTVNAAGYNLLYYNVRIGSVRLGSLASYVVSVLAATVVTFAGNRFWTFRHRAGHGATQDGVRFLVLSGVGMIVQYLPVGAANYLLGLTGRLWNNIALITGVGIATLFRFWSYRRWVWGATAPGVATAGAPVPGGVAPAYAHAGGRQPGR